MNKKLVCLTLSILMLLSCLLTGCSSSTSTEGEGDAESTVDNSAKTITMWLITGDETTDEAMKAVNEKFTEITKSKFKTHVELKFCTEEEYYEKLESAIKTTQDNVLLEEEARKELRKYLAAHKNDGKTKTELTADFFAANTKYAPVKDKLTSSSGEDESAADTEEETIINEEYGIAEIKYPDADENQVDIFYIGTSESRVGGTVKHVSGYEKYMQYYNDEWLAPLSEELSTSSKKLTDYISTSLLNGVQIEGSVYAIPNNVPIGEYTYMFIDKALFDKYYHKIDKVSTVLNLNTFLHDVSNENAGKEATDADYIVPLASSYSECAQMLCWYWDLSYTDRSVYEMYYDEERDRNYVVKIEYEVEVESSSSETSTDGGAATPQKQKVLTNMVVGDQLYKTNDDGQFVDKDGNVLDYRYELDTEGYYLSGKNNKIEYKAKAGGNGMYLVDGDGNAVTKDNDKRVILTAEDDGIETEIDENGNFRPTYIYSYNRNADFSVLGAMKLDPAKRTRGSINLGFEALFTQNDAKGKDYHTLYATLMDYDYQGYYGTPAEGQSAAVSFVKGDARILQEYNAVMAEVKKGNNSTGYVWNKANETAGNTYYVEDGKAYYVVVAEYPEATEDELYGNMFAVYANSANISRSMKVITYLNTNKEMRDLLQYGIEDVHYERNEGADEGTVSLLSNHPKSGTYRMDIERTGNCFIATPEKSMGADAWKYAKLQNNDSLIDPLLGFDFNTATADSEYALDILLIDHIRELNEQALEMIADCKDKAELLSLMSDPTDGFVKLYSASAGDTKFNKATNSAYDPSQPLGPEVENQTPDTDGSSPYTVYYTWLTTYGYLATDKKAE